jgi:hypothetical protein
MARTTQTQNQLPDESEWAGVTVAPEKIVKTQPYGRVTGIDYDRYAVAWEDAQQKPDRLRARSRDLEAKGFKPAPGDWTVHGVPTPVLVWVMPRALYEKRREAKRQALVDRVAMGLYPESALPSERTHRA